MRKPRVDVRVGDTKEGFLGEDSIFGVWWVWVVSIIHQVDEAALV